MPEISFTHIGACSTAPVIFTQKPYLLVVGGLSYSGIGGINFRIPRMYVSS